MEKNGATERLPAGDAADIAARYRRLINEASDIVYETDARGRFVHVNPMASRLLGYPIDALLGRSYLDLIRPDARAAAERFYGRQFVRGTPTTYYEFPVLTAAGDEIWLGQNVRLIREGGRAVGFEAIARDVTARRRAEEALRESEDRYRSLIAALEEGIVLQDPDGTILASNPSAERILGLTADELRGRSSLDGSWHAVQEDGSPFPGVDHPAMVALRTGRPCSNVVMGLPKPDGTLTWISINSQPIVREGETAPYAVVTSLTDITESRRVGRELAERTRRLEAVRSVTEEIARELDLGVLLGLITRRAVDLVGAQSGTTLLWDAAEEALIPAATQGTAEWTAGLRFRLGEGLVGRVAARRAGLIVDDYRSWPDAHPEVLERTDVNQLLAEPLLHRDQLCGVIVLNRVGGDPPFTAADADFLRLFAGQAAVAIRNASLYTELAAANARLAAALDQNERQYRAAERARGESRAVLDAASEAMALISPNCRFRTVNRQFGDLLGRAPEDLAGRTLDDLRPDIGRVFADPDAFARRIAETAADSDRRFTEVVAQQSPDRRELELFSAPVEGAEGDHLGRLYVFRDVTRQREVERLKTEFVSLVSHELRTPLTAIKGYVDLLLDGEVGAIAADQREFLEVVGSNADRLVELINNLLDISRIETDQAGLSPSSIDLSSLIRRAAGALAPRIEAKDQRLTIDLPRDLPAAWGDPGRVGQVLRNLLSNAHKYTPAGGSIEVAARHEAGRVWIAVRDDGIGLSPDEQTRIFAAFSRARNRTTEEVGGTGLGLAIARSLVELHGGELSVASRPGAGSTFRFSLPVDPSPQAG